MPEKIEPQLDEIRRRARRRLVGAVVLALAAAVLVPMLLESDPRPLGEDVAVKIPPVDEGKFVSKLGEKSRSTDAPPTPIKPLPAAKPAESASPAKEGAAPSKAASAEVPPVPQAAPPKPTIVPPLSSPPVKESAPATSPPAKESGPATDTSASSPPVKPAAPATSTPTAPAAPEASKASKSASGAFSVQLAAFSDDKGANALVNRLKKAGHPAYTEQYASARGTVWRVRVGPYGTREAAEGARSRLKADGQDGIIATSN